MTEISELVAAGDLPDMLHEALVQSGRTLARETVIITSHSPGGEGKTIAHGRGTHRRPESDPISRGYRCHFTFEVNVGSHKDAKLVFDPLEVNITTDE